MTVSSALRGVSPSSHISFLITTLPPKLFPTSSSSTATIDPFTSDGRDESSFFTGRQSRDRTRTYIHAYPHVVTVLALERDLSRKERRNLSYAVTHAATIYAYGARGINHCSDLRQHLEHDNCAPSALTNYFYARSTYILANVNGRVARTGCRAARETSSKSKTSLISFFNVYIFNVLIVIRSIISRTPESLIICEKLRALH